MQKNPQLVEVEYMVKYNPVVLGEFANKIYRKANWIIVQWVIVGLFIGFIPGVFISAAFEDMEDEQDINENATIIIDSICFLFLGMGLIIGVLIGQEKTLDMRAKAQLILCYREMENRLSGIQASLGGQAPSPPAAINQPMMQPTYNSPPSDLNQYPPQQ